MYACSVAQSGNSGPGMATYQKDIEEGPKDYEDMSGSQITTKTVRYLHVLLDFLFLCTLVDGIRLSFLCSKNLTLGN